jgi:hypothetical protein
MRVGSAVVSAGISTEDTGGSSYARNTDDIADGGYYKYSSDEPL